MSLGTDWGSDPYPVRQPDETFVEYQAREREWRRRHPGETRHSYDIGQSWSPSGGKPAFPATSVGMPTAFAKFPATGEQLGDFEIASPSLLPAALRPAAGIAHPTPHVRHNPEDWTRGLPHHWTPEAPPPYPSPVPTTPGSPPWFFTPGGAVAPGLRAPFDLPPEEIRRRQVLEATQFDTDWGEPPSGDGLQWSTTKFVYEPTKDDAGSPYRYPAQHGIYEQAFQGGSVPIGRWGVRWVDTTRTPYRILPASERHVWDLYVQSAQRHGSEKGSRGGLLDRSNVTPPIRDYPLLGDLAADIELPPGYGPPPKKFNLGDYAWIPQRDLPMGCPYPYPYLPVPQEDYASGRWLAPDYVPSISLPPPYDQTPWQCGATPQAVERKKGKQGEPYRNLLGDITDRDAIQLSEAARVEAETARRAAEAASKTGIPSSTGTAAPDEVGAHSTKVAQLEKEAKALAARIAGSHDPAQAERDKAELGKITQKIGAENAWLEHLRVVKEKQDSGDDGYAVPREPAVGIPPNIVMRGSAPGNPPRRASRRNRGMPTLIAGGRARNLRGPVFIVRYPFRSTMTTAQRIAAIMAAYGLQKQDADRVNDGIEKLRAGARALRAREYDKFRAEGRLAEALRDPAAFFTPQDWGDTIRLINPASMETLLKDTMGEDEVGFAIPQFEVRDADADFLDHREVKRDGSVSVKTEARNPTIQVGGIIFLPDPGSDLESATEVEGVEEHELDHIEAAQIAADRAVAEFKSTHRNATLTRAEMTAMSIPAMRAGSAASGLLDRNPTDPNLPEADVGQATDHGRVVWEPNITSDPLSRTVGDGLGSTEVRGGRRVRSINWFDANDLQGFRNR
jgi:hypothetical protein